MTRTMRRRSVKWVMSSATSKRLKGLVAQVCGAVIILALVAAPVCAPWCAAKVCSQGTAPAAVDSSCHGMATERGSAMHAHAAQNCGAHELPAATVNSANKNEVQHNDRSEAFGAGLDIRAQEISSPSERSRDDCLGGASSPQISSSLSLASVLRI